MTSAELGVLFAVRPGHPEQVSWTAPNAEDAFLALDLNRNGTIDDGSELFGNFTPQPPPSDNQERNGFLALAEYDALEQGGNSNGYIDEKDAIFNQLSLWFDTNHDGISDLGELHGLAEFSVRSINLNYHESRYTDEYGNEFRYRAKVERKESQANTSFMYDVFLTAQ